MTLTSFAYRARTTGQPGLSARVRARADFKFRWFDLLRTTKDAIAEYVEHGRFEIYIGIIIIIIARFIHSRDDYLLAITRLPRREPSTRD
jgi:hypothetical protein